jgi:hypothetical protein
MRRICSKIGPLQAVMAAALSALSLMVSAGCGSSAEVSKSEVQQRTWQYVKDQVGTDASVDDFGCIQDGSSHWKCLSTVRFVGVAPQQVSVSVTCDGDQCLFEPS